MDRPRREEADDETVALGRDGRRGMSIRLTGCGGKHAESKNRLTVGRVQRAK